MCKCSNNACIVVAFRMGSILTKVYDDQLPEEVLICNIVHTIPCIDLQKVYVYNWRDMETVEGNAG